MFKTPFEKNPLADNKIESIFRFQLFKPTVQIMISDFCRVDNIVDKGKECWFLFVPLHVLKDLVLYQPTKLKAFADRWVSATLS